MSEEMNKEAEVQEEAVDIPVTDGSEEEAADTAQTAEEETSEEPAQTEETEQSDQEAESQKEPETKTKTSFFGKKKKEKDKFEQQVEELTDRLKRNMAEFDNFRKRTEKEKSTMFEMGASDIIKKLLPIVDNFDRGFKSVTDEELETPFAKGMDMVHKQLLKMLEDADVKPIEALGGEFNPDFHNAVMHVEDDSVGENIVVEEFEKGYTYRDQVIRHSMVKVAN